jgi:hypothetical protein
MTTDLDSYLTAFGPTHEGGRSGAMSPTRQRC